MRQFHNRNGILLLPEKIDAPLFTVCCIAEKEDAEMLARILPEETAAVLCPAEEWSTLSPFFASALRAGEPDFTPGAGKMLEQVKDTLDDFMECYPLRSDPQGHGLLGYSLAGLCVLYALHERAPDFRWFYALSASVWMEGWKEYAAVHPPFPDAHVWLSLGGKEPNTRDPRMCRVGDGYREEKRLLEKYLPQGNVQMTWHPGGHFSDIPGRMKKALEWKRG